MIDTLTIVGRVATDPTQAQTAGGVPVTNFRVASTHRRFDLATQEWSDSGTNWFSVAAFRQLGENAKASLRTGDSVIVTGRLKIRDWESNGRHGTSVDIEADAIGHDLRWGTTAYRPRPRSTSSEPDAARSSAATVAVQETADDTQRPEGEEPDTTPLALSWEHPTPITESR
ncbi:MULTISPECIES: single-stranded DNA-binding protein [unclassified Microbacterium]|uniref:single-stranded DNA-binding protein n=1 Tax=unclassified Microbacterium TaxID=2609290 RepID=UPI001604C6CA|nr:MULTISPECIES: single-stranded DNA-binding protein [unclassified Microbacterium]QNA92576.1 single-stranded DNA-binding protein [Microbacterium sp. Se63.02b]QYM65874.1 single-stranded DNA-binding protein [Microbacterium sp. Se5.02b]